MSGAVCPPGPESAPLPQVNLSRSETGNGPPARPGPPIQCRNSFSFKRRTRRVLGIVCDAIRGMTGHQAARLSGAVDVERHPCPRCNAHPAARAPESSPAPTAPAASPRCPGSRNSCGCRPRPAAPGPTVAARHPGALPGRSGGPEHGHPHRLRPPPARASPAAGRRLSPTTCSTPSCVDARTGRPSSRSSPT